jgi:hypothetical protein
VGRDRQEGFSEWGDTSIAHRGRRQPRYKTQHTKVRGTHEGPRMGCNRGGCGGPGVNGWCGAGKGGTPCPSLAPHPSRSHANAVHHGGARGAKPFDEPHLLTHPPAHAPFLPHPTPQPHAHRRQRSAVSRQRHSKGCPREHLGERAAHLVAPVQLPCAAVVCLVPPRVLKQGQGDGGVPGRIAGVCVGTTHQAMGAA